MTPEEAAAGFAALGSEARLAVLRTLVRAGREGLAIGAIQTRLDIPASTLAHHLRMLASADLIEQARDGRTVLTRAKFDRVAELAGYLTHECCRDAPKVAPRKEVS